MVISFLTRQPANRMWLTFVLFVLLCGVSNAEPAVTTQAPSWYLTEQYHKHFLVGYGQGPTLAIADRQAQTNLSEQLGIQVEVTSQTQQQLNSNNGFESNNQFQSSSVQHSKQKLLGAHRNKQQFNGQWYVAWVVDMRSDSVRLSELLTRNFPNQSVRFVGNQAIVNSDLINNVQRSNDYLANSKLAQMSILVDLHYQHQNWWLQVGEHILLIHDIAQVINWQQFNDVDHKLTTFDQHNMRFGHQVKSGQEFYLKLSKQSQQEHCVMLNLYADGRVVLLDQNNETDSTWVFPSENSELVLSATLLDEVETQDTYMTVCSATLARLSKFQTELFLTAQSTNRNYRWHDLMYELSDPKLSVATFTMEVYP